MTVGAAVDIEFVFFSSFFSVTAKLLYVSHFSTLASGRIGSFLPKVR
jgi:hypothetical protein